MVPKSSLFIRIVAGAYVIYLGEKLINSSLADKPENYILYIAAGLCWLVGSGIKMVKKEYRDDSIRGRMNESENETEEVKATEENESEEPVEETEESATPENDKPVR